LEVTPTILDQSSRTEGVVTYKYALPLRLISVEPSVVFTTDNSGVYIRGEDLYATNDLKCVWSSNGDITSTTAILDDSNNAYSCNVPVLPVGQANVTISINNVIETHSLLSITVVDQPVVTSLYPPRSVVEFNSTITLHGHNFYTDAPDPRCIYTQGDVNISYSTADIVSSNLIRCHIPPAVTSQREIQSISIQSPPQTKEVQVVEVVSLPDRPEIQRITTSSWGVDNAEFELAITPLIPSEDKAKLMFETNSTGAARVVDIPIHPPAFKHEVQSINITVTVTKLDEYRRQREDKGIITINMGVDEIDVAWNATEDEMKYAIESLPVVRSVSVGP
jgi:hypothetical protein